MPDPKKSEDVRKELAARAEDAIDTRNELVFDPTTGELVAKPRNADLNPDAVVVSDIADDGFFLN